MVDEEWLLKHKPEATDDEIYAFIERVSIKLDGNIDYKAVEASRKEALNAV